MHDYGVNTNRRILRRAKGAELTEGERDCAHGGIRVRVCELRPLREHRPLFGGRCHGSAVWRMQGCDERTTAGQLQQVLRARHATRVERRRLDREPTEADRAGSRAIGDARGDCILDITVREAPRHGDERIEGDGRQLRRPSPQGNDGGLRAAATVTESPDVLDPGLPRRRDDALRDGARPRHGGVLRRDRAGDDQDRHSDNDRAAGTLRASSAQNGGIRHAMDLGEAIGRALRCRRRTALRRRRRHSAAAELPLET